MNAAKRRGMLFLALAGVAGWSGWLALSDTPDVELGRADDQTVEPVVRLAASPMPARPLAANVESEPRLALAEANLFPQQGWYVPPPPPPPPPAYVPPPPRPPPLPYRYMGRWQEAGDTTYYLTRGTLPVSVRTGQVLDGVWRLDAAADDTLDFTYLPLNQTLSLRTGE